jgi:hypothetical protein
MYAILMTKVMIKHCKIFVVMYDFIHIKIMRYGCNFNFSTPINLI